MNPRRRREWRNDRLQEINGEVVEVVEPIVEEVLVPVIEKEEEILVMEEPEEEIAEPEKESEIKEAVARNSIPAKKKGRPKK